MLKRIGHESPTSKFDPMEFFEGRTKAWGIFEDRFGRLKRQFVVIVDGYWQDGEFVLDEDFSYGDGDRERRIWRLTPDGKGGFRARTDDCVGEGHGRLDGRSARLCYVIRLRVGKRRIKVRFDDRMHRLDGDVVVNRATVSKWGVRLGEVSLFFTRQRDADVAARSCAA